ncbi:PQQ-binding-like beta-propeller repeat protein [Rhodopirellula sp. MGV]|uniref:outer membrane protein assembly factor BamB family protein n=1 Tax=Rhodopirellula sp. MGV TaxID=2023130 RepID=UPI000B96EC47|nr:PQQ-binding-like beta-propeller repeat protein [Rhodopirellula sp. MGV]OYP37952.1 serine/threonine protein kinase [Rhodopirellula sp. MGV]PNY34254.1 serine/threonine protein kinase [Rhodopirellula baltica]
MKRLFPSRRRRVISQTVLSLLACTSSFAVADEFEWPKFQNAGNSVNVNLPTEWSPTENIAWTADIVGYGQSTPIVAHQQVVVTSTSGENKDNYHISSFSLTDGSPNWQVDVSNPSPFKNSPMVSRAAPSAVATQEGFVAFFEGGVLAAVSPDGTIRWEKNLVEQFGPIEARHGLAASLESDAKRVFVWVERSEDPYVLAIDPATGEQLWKAPGVGSASWASPRLVDVGDRQHLVCSAKGKIVGMDPESGNQLWVFEDVINNTSCTPMPAGNSQFLVGASDGRGESSAGDAASSNGLVQIRPQADGTFDVSYKWQATKATSTFGSPIVAGKTAAIVNRAGVLYRFDLESGEEISVERTDAGGIWATPLVAGNNLYLFGYKGTTSVISLENGKEIAENRCWEAAAEDPGFGGGSVLYAATPAPPYLLIRRGDRIYAVK